MKTVLILTASFGGGHYTAARNLSEALESLSPEAKVEVLDLFQSSYGRLNSIVQKAYTGLARFAPALWGGLSSLIEKPALMENRGFKLERLRRELGHVLLETLPDVVVSTYPLYASIIHDLYRDHAERPFRLVTIVTDAIGVNPAWLHPSSDFYCCSSEAAAAVLQEGGIPAAKIGVYGFPVSPLFSQAKQASALDPAEGAPCRILYLANAGNKKLGKSLKRLLEHEENHLTIAVGRDAYLKAELTQKLKRYGDRVKVLGWTNQLPHLMMSHHLLVGKAGGALVQEAIAARCPMIANQVSPGPEEGNAKLLIDHDIGVVAPKPRETAHWARLAFKHHAKLWRQWRRNLDQLSKPDASLRIARLLLEMCAADAKYPTATDSTGLRAQPPVLSRPKPPATGHPRSLLCDFHIHTNYSDGKLSAAEVIDFYGRRHFDCICITDHLADSRRLIGKLGKLSRLTLSPGQLEEYFEVLERERRRAWRKYNMLVMTGLEFNKDGLTKKSSAHLLGIDLHMPIVDCLDLPETIAQIHAQGGLAVASHPHIMKSEWGKNTLYLWENQERFAPLLDAWEVANRNNMFNPVSTKRLPYLANSDFHKPRHIYSWKTLVTCEKNPAAIKDCIRKNERIAITLYRDSGLTAELAEPVPQDVGEIEEMSAVEDNEPLSPLLPAA